MPLGYLDKEITPEGPFKLIFHSLEIPNPTVTIQNLRLWFTDIDTNTSYLMADGFPTVDDGGEPAWGFTGNTFAGRELLPDGTLEVSVSTVDGSTTPITTSLEPAKVYRADVTYEDAIIGLTAVGLQLSVLVNPSKAIELLQE